MNNEPTAAAKESQAKWDAAQDWKGEGCFNFNRYEKGTLESSAYAEEAHRIAEINGDLL